MDLIQCQIEQRVMVLTLNRPDKLNALTHNMYATLAAHLHSANHQPEIQAILIQANGSAFCAGNDLDDFLEANGSLFDTPVHQFLQQLIQLDKPLIAAVSGAAIGIGTTLLLHCDLVYCSPQAQFALPFINLGLVPEAASSVLLPLRVGTVRAAELLLLGQSFSASYAERCGLINAIVAAPELAAHAMAQATAIAAKPPQALQSTKALLKQMAPDLTPIINAELRAYEQALAGDEAKACLTALRKRTTRT